MGACRVLGDTPPEVPSHALQDYAQPSPKLPERKPPPPPPPPPPPAKPKRTGFSARSTFEKAPARAGARLQKEKVATKAGSSLKARLKGAADRIGTVIGGTGGKKPLGGPKAEKREFTSVATKVGGKTTASGSTLAIKTVSASALAIPSSAPIARGIDALTRPGRDLANQVGQAFNTGVTVVKDVGQQIFNTTKDVGLGVVNAVKDAILGTPDLRDDGKIIGAGGQLYDPRTPLSEVPPTPATVRVDPNGVPIPPRTVFLTTGILTDTQSQTDAVNAFAANGLDVYGVRNSTQGILGDLVQSGLDKARVGNNPAVETLTNSVASELSAGRDVSLIGYSQGAEITARALWNVRDQLLQSGKTPEQVEEIFRQHVEVETFGAAGNSYPDGPSYVHYLSEGDVVANTVGIDSPVLPEHLGEGAVVKVIPARTPWQLSIPEHDLNSYLPYYVPFDQARATFPSAAEAGK